MLKILCCSEEVKCSHLTAASSSETPLNCSINADTVQSENRDTAGSDNGNYRM
jgi:hypothetical protein